MSEKARIEQVDRRKRISKGEDETHLSMYILGMLGWKGQWGAFLSIFRPMTFILDQNKRIAYSLIGTRFESFQLQKYIFVKI